MFQKVVLISYRQPTVVKLNLMPTHYEGNHAWKPELLSSWTIVEKNLLPLICYTSIVYYYILNLKFVANTVILHCGSTNKQHKGWLNTGTEVCL